MGKTVKDRQWRSIHSDYLRFAVQSLRVCLKDQDTPLVATSINRDVIEVIRYSYDCLEASVEFVFLMGQQRQLPISIEDNWLTRHLKRKWNNLSLSDRIGLLTYAWANDSFWLEEPQFQLFNDLKKVRDGLTHPVPFGTEIEFEIIPDEETARSHVYGARRPTGKLKFLTSDKLVNTKQVANFKPSADLLDERDAEQALEILLRHLIRLEDVFFNRRTTWFSFYDSDTKQILSTEDLLQEMDRSFDHIWESS